MVPSGSYRRVGYGIWQDCTRYGFDCSEAGRFKPTRMDRSLRKMKKWMGEGRGMLKSGLGEHKHNVEGSVKNDRILYAQNTTVSRQTLVII